jgi:hypothetical protein
VADRRDCLVRCVEVLDQLDRARLRSQLLRIHHTAGQQQRVEILGFDFVEPRIEAYILAPVGVVPTPGFAPLGAGDDRLDPDLLEHPLGLDQVGLFESLGGEDEDALGYDEAPW